MSTYLEKLYFIILGVILTSSLLFVSCGKNGDGDADVFNPPTDDIKNIGKDVGKSAEDLKKTTNTIKENATDGMKKTPPNAQPVLNPYWSNILMATGMQYQLVQNLEQQKLRAEAAEQKSAEFEKAYNDKESERKKQEDRAIAAEDGVTKQLRQKYMGYSGVLFFIALICGGIAVFANGNRYALYGGLTAAAGAATCIFIVQTVALIPWIMGGLGVIALALVVYTMFFKDKKINIFSTATRELVETIEAIKPRMTLAGRKEVFGDGPTKGDAFSIQSRDTEAVVKDVRATIENAPKIPATIAADVNGDGVIDSRDIMGKPIVLT